MEWHELAKKRVIDLREMMKEHLPEVTGVTGRKKEELVEMLAVKLGIEAPTKRISGIDKTSLKQMIRELKARRDEALATKDAASLHEHRRAIHRIKRRMRRAQKLS